MLWTIAYTTTEIDIAKREVKGNPSNILLRLILPKTRNMELHTFRVSKKIRRNVKLL